jgi:hypothetical protein
MTSTDPPPSNLDTDAIAWRIAVAGGDTVSSPFDGSAVCPPPQGLLMTFVEPLVSNLAGQSTTANEPARDRASRSPGWDQRFQTTYTAVETPSPRRPLGPVAVPLVQLSRHRC